MTTSIILEGTSVQSRFGSSIDGLGDINGDVFHGRQPCEENVHHVDHTIFRTIYCLLKSGWTCF